MGTLAAAWAGRVLAVALIALPVGWTLAPGESFDLASMIWLVAIAAFMWMGASQSIKATRVRERLPGISARGLARKAIPIPADTAAGRGGPAGRGGQRPGLVVVDHDSTPRSPSSTRPP